MGVYKFVNRGIIKQRLWKGMEHTMATRAFSIEEGNLGSTTTISTKSVDYSDLDLSFTTNSIQDVYKKKDAAAVKQSVKTIILTDYGEKPFEPFFGTDIRSLLFELFNFGLSQDIKRRVITAIQDYEPRAIVKDVNVTESPDTNYLNIEVTFTVINTTQLITLNTTISRLR